MHIRVTSVGRLSGGAKKLIAGLEYDKREGLQHQKRADELESAGGRNTAEMTHIIQAVDASTTRKNGKIGLDYEIELPAEMTADQRRLVAERIADYFEARNVPCHWAVHSHNERGQYQPHLHMTTTARAVERVENGEWIVSTRGPSIIDGPAAMQAFRREVVAGSINAVAKETGAELAAEWHGGRLGETGIARPPKTRRPVVAIKREERARADDHGLADTCRAIDAGDYATVIDARKKFVEREKQAQEDRRKAREMEREKARMSPPTDQKKPVTPTEKAVRIATEKQCKMIAEMAHERGLQLPPDALERLDGGDLIAAVRGLVEHFHARITAAEERVARAREQTLWAIKQRDEARRQAAPQEPGGRQEAARSPLPPPAAPAPPRPPAAPAAPQEAAEARPLSVGIPTTQAEFEQRLSAGRAKVAGLDNSALMATLAVTRAELAATPQARHNTRQGLQTGIEIATAEAQRRGLLAQPTPSRGRER